ncbi:MAG: hypothetical protein Fur005_47350 [Roseiflexaceae bacterium]
MTKLADLLLGIPSFADPNTRNTMLDMLEPAVRNSVIRHPSPRIETLNIVRTVLNYPNGLESLLEAIRWIEADSLPMRKLDDYVKSLR